MSLSPDEIRQLLAAVEKSEWDDAVITVGDTSIAVSRNGATLPIAPVAAAAPPAPPAPAPTAAPVVPPAGPVAPAAPAAPVADGVEVASPTVGIFWRSPQPGAPSFVEVGARVEAGDVVCIVEVMKLMNNVTAPVTGTVSAVLADNASPVEFGQVLLTIVPEVG